MGEKVLSFLEIECPVREAISRQSSAVDCITAS
jgi:hypothetical protein